jgi:hypothetical protein
MIIDLSTPSIVHERIYSTNQITSNKILQPRISIDELVSIAHEARPRNSNEVLQQSNGVLKLREVAAGQKIWETAEDFTDGNDLELSIINFLESSTGEKVDGLYCVDPTRPSNRELVYLTKNYAVKVFGEERFNRIPPELSGQDLVKKLNLYEGKTVEFITIGKCEIYGQKKLLLLMQRAPGETIKDSLDSIFTSSNPLSALNECKSILTQLGRFLGEIHSSTAVTYRGDTPGLLEVTREKLKLQIEMHLEAYKKSGGEDFDAIHDFFDKTLALYDTHTFHLTLSHGDAHLANFIFDSSEHSMTLIDTPWVPYSVNDHDQPLFASFAKDVGRVEVEIATCVLNHAINEEYISELQEAFRKGYREKAQKLVNPSQMFAEKACIILDRLNSVVQRRTQDGPRANIYVYFTNFFKKTPSEEL